MKVAAHRLGLNPAAYASKILSGEKWCNRCREWKQRDAFGRDKSRGDGRASACIECRDQVSDGRPTNRERRVRASVGESWCCDCARWFPTNAIRNGRCKVHRNADERRRYANDAAFRHYRKNQVSKRRRGVDAVPLEAREVLLDYFDGECAYCGNPAESWDHIVPVSKGGTTTPWNIVPACRSCNSRKRDRDPDDWLASIDEDRARVVYETMLLEDMPTHFHVAQSHNSTNGGGSP